MLYIFSLRIESFASIESIASIKFEKKFQRYGERTTWILDIQSLEDFKFRKFVFLLQKDYRSNSLYFLSLRIDLS